MDESAAGMVFNRAYSVEAPHSGIHQPLFDAKRSRGPIAGEEPERQKTPFVARYLTAKKEKKKKKKKKNPTHKIRS